MLNTYELTLIFRTTLSEEDRRKILETVKSLIGKTGKILETLDMGKRFFAYPIRKEKEGNYTFYRMETGAKEAVEIAGKLKMDEKVLRYLLVRAEKPESKREQSKKERK